MTNRRVAERQQAGGDVYMMDPSSYPVEQMRWLAEQTGLNARDLQTFTGEQAFTCGHTRFLRLVPRTE